MKRLLITLCLTLLMTCTIYGQPPDAGNSPQSTATNPGDNDDDTIKVNVVNITLPVSVFDGKGQFARNLKRENFQVLENSQAQPIVEFHAEADLPLNVAVLMDTSTSVRNRLEFERTAIKQFVASILHSERDKVAFVTFDTTIQMREDFTSNIATINKSVDDIKAIGGQTSLFDAICKVCRENMARTSGRRRVIVAITDGADTNSTHTLAQAISLAQRTETTIYALSTKGGAVFRVEGSAYQNADDREIKKLCRDTGGEVFFPESAEELTKAFKQVGDFLRNQYILVYEPTNADGEFHKIEVKVVGKKGLSAINRQGYKSNK